MDARNEHDTGAWAGAWTAMPPSEAQARLMVLVQGCPLGIFFDDPEDRCVFANEAFCQLMEMTPEEALGDGWTLRVHPEDLPGLLAARAASVAAGEPVFRAEYRFVTPSGRAGWVEEQTRPVFSPDGALWGYVGTVTDITRRKDEEALLQRLNAELSAQVAQDRAEICAHKEQVADLSAALRVLLAQREADREAERRAVVANVQGRILPAVERLLGLDLPPRAQEAVQELVRAVHEAASPLTRRLMDLGLTRAELRVAELVQAGLSIKETAQRLGVAQTTVESHRRSLRRKLGLSRRGSLRAALAALEG
ncbi:MAG: PAS domain-containing protein [Desulfomicrobiaceae bacterium]|nr:PAS domain-containing protein [Desulfomicrobiaceae bacterium]